jgi:hypothetical protein
MSDENEPKTLLMDGFDKAFVGGLLKFGQSIPIAVYDYGRVMDILMERDGLEEDEAAEYIEFNIVGGWHGEGTPCMLSRCTLREFVEDCGEDIDGSRDFGDEDPLAFPDEEGMTKDDQRLYRQAINDFCFNFIRYVKETEPTLYSRAKDYAKDYSGNSLIEFVDVEEEDEGKDGKP